MPASKTNGPPAIKMLVLAENRKDFDQLLGSLGIEREFFDTVPQIIDAVLDQPGNVGLVLDLHKVMKSDSRNRDRLFALARNRPVIRCRRNSRTENVEFLDDLKALASKAMESLGFNTREQPRVDVALNALVSTSDDPMLSRPEKANILNLANTGCFLYTLGDFSEENFVYLRIMELSNHRPIHCAIRWRRPWGEPDSLPGLGLRFLDLAQDQMEDIRVHYLIPLASEES